MLGLTDSLEIAIELSKDDGFAAMTADVWEWFKLIMTNDLRAFVNVTTHLKQYFSDRSRQDMLLDLIVLLVRDVMLLKFEEHGRTSFAMHHDELRAFSEKSAHKGPARRRNLFWTQENCKQSTFLSKTSLKR